MKIDLVVETELSESSRVQQLSAMFDIPPATKSRLEWHGELPVENEVWNVGLIVGPSGSGKTSIARQLFGEHYEPFITWGAGSVIDDFPKQFGMQEISSVCQAVGFNTIPAWMRPHAVLSNGEKFRVDLARRLLECVDPIVVDEFTSVVDRQVAQIGAHAVQKFIRKNNRKFVAVSCHYDILDWLQPDWVFEPATMHFARRCLQRRPALDVTISRVPYAAWKMFAPFHYLTAELARSARCFGLFVGDRITSFCGVLHRPHPRVRDIKAVSRVVTLPDWQGLGLAFVLIDKLAAAYKALGYRFRNYPAHPAFVRAHQRAQSMWRQTKESGVFSHANSNRLRKFSGEIEPDEGGFSASSLGGRPCAVFEYIGPAMNSDEAQLLIAA